MRGWMILLALAACPHPRTTPDPGTPEPAPVGAVPTLEIETPARGTFVDDGAITVRGRVRDDGPVRVVVNGTPAEVAGDGAFAVNLQLPRGMSIVEIHAVDATGIDVRDVRAVLAGPFSASDGKIAAPIGARLGRSTIVALGNVIAASAKAIDFRQAAQALNPIYEETGCLGARVDIANVNVGDLAVELAPARAAIEAVVRVSNIEVKLDVGYRAACLGSTTSMTVRTHARVRAEIKAQTSAGRVRTAIQRPDVTLDGFQLDMKVPGVIESLLRKVTRPAVEIALAQLIASKLPPLVDAKLGELLTRPALPQVLGREVDLVLSPSWIDVQPTGIAMVADASLAVRGGAAGRYAATREALPVPAGDTLVWLSANAVNQLFAGLWAAHAFDRTLPRDQLGPLAMLLDQRIAGIELALALPPTLHADRVLELVVGDLSITARDASGAEVQRFAVSLRTGLAIRPDHRLGTTEPAVYAQLLAQHGPMTTPLDGVAVEGVVKGAWSLMASSIDDALAQIPMPGLAKGAEVKTVSARGGAIVLDLAVK